MIHTGGPRKGYIVHELISSFFLFYGPILNLHYVQTQDPSPQGSRGKPPPFFDELYTLFSRTTHDRDNLICNAPNFRVKIFFLHH
jgi:hypothetical protein